MEINLFVTIREAKKKFKKKINLKKFNWVEAAAEDGYTSKKILKIYNQSKLNH